MLEGRVPLNFSLGVLGCDNRASSSREIPEPMRSFAKGISRFRSEFASGRLSSFGPFIKSVILWLVHLLCGAFTFK